jgi:hypothetical protein
MESREDLTVLHGCVVTLCALSVSVKRRFKEGVGAAQKTMKKESLALRGFGYGQEVLMKFQCLWHSLYIYTYFVVYLCHERHPLYA